MHKPFCTDAFRMSQLSRREALQVGVGLFGLSLPNWLDAQQASAARKKEVSCIFLFLAGGPSHYETFDPKPDAREGIRGIWNPIQTNVPGTFICEKMPLLAQRMDKVAIVRSWQGQSGSHAAGSQHVLSGVNPGRNGQFYPNFGCVLDSLFGPMSPGVPSHFGLPVAGRYTRPAGYLGPSFGAFDVDNDPNQPEFQLKRSLSVARARFDERKSLLTQVDNLGRLFATSTAELTTHNEVTQEAFNTLTSQAMQQAGNLAEEPDSLREKYGRNVYGQRVLLARRLVEAGARFVTINQAVQGGPYKSPNRKIAGTWDNHGKIFDYMMSFGDGPGNLPQLDMSLSALLDDLDDKGMLDSTLVVAMGEFGRTPKINSKGGRDHYPKAGSVLMAGAGVGRGVVVGATDTDGTAPTTQPARPEDFAATIYHLMGIDPEATFYPKLPRPTRIAEGSIIEGLLA